MGDAHGALGPVDVLAAGAAGPVDVDPQVLVVDRDVDVLGLGQHGHGRGRGVDAAAALGHRHPLHPVHAGLVLEPGEHPLPRDLGHDLLDPAEIALAHRQDLAAPALEVGVALVHAQEVAGEQRGLVAAGAGADLQDRVLVVGRVLGQQQQPHLPLQLRQPRLERPPLGLDQIAHLPVGAGIARPAAPARAARAYGHGTPRWSRPRARGRRTPWRAWHSRRADSRTTAPAARRGGREWHRAWDRGRIRTWRRKLPEDHPRGQGPDAPTQAGRSRPMRAGAERNRLSASSPVGSRIG